MTWRRVCAEGDVKVGSQRPQRRIRLLQFTGAGVGRGGGLVDGISAAGGLVDGRRQRDSGERVCQMYGALAGAHMSSRGKYQALGQEDGGQRVV